MNKEKAITILIWLNPIIWILFIVLAESGVIRG